MNDDWHENYGRLAPYVIVIAATFGALVGGAPLWVIPVVIVLALAWAVVRVRIGRQSVDRRLRKRD